MRGKRVTVYVRETDLDLWRRAKEYAEERRMTSSGLVMLALERYLDEQERPADER